MKAISAKELEKLYENEDICVLDIREEEEVAQGKIPGAMHLPVSQFVEKVEQLDKDLDYYIICRTNRRSSAIAKELISKGYKATVVSDGMQGWDGKTE